MLVQLSKLYETVHVMRFLLLLNLLRNNVKSTVDEPMTTF